MALKPLLSIKNLFATAQEKSVLQDINLEIHSGQTHVIIGANGVGKSSLGHLLVGKPHYQATKGTITFTGENLLEMSPAQRAHQGLFMAFQNPVTIPGVTNMNFLHTALNENRKAQGKSPLKMPDSLRLIKEKMAQLNIPLTFLRRGMNDNFSGGEKKRNELLQMVLLQPKLAILDETDSGLDLQMRQLMGRVINEMKQRGIAFILITHYIDLLHTIQPDRIHLMKNGMLNHVTDITMATQLLTNNQPTT